MVGCFLVVRTRVREVLSDHFAHPKTEHQSALGLIQCVLLGQYNCALRYQQVWWSLLRLCFSEICHR
jgi:hypothetical protein